MTAEMLATLAGSGALGAAGSLFMSILRGRSDAREADARVVEVVHEVYDGTMEMLRSEIDDNRQNMKRLRDEVARLYDDNKKLRGRIQFLEAFIVRKGLTVPEEG
jgi:predicted nuclease with TOPRIM domain